MPGIDGLEEFLAVGQGIGKIELAHVGLVLELIGDGGHHAEFLDLGVVLVFAVDAELALVGGDYLAEFAAGVLGELLCRHLCVGYCFFHHPGFHLLEGNERVGDRLGVLAVDDGNALAQEFSLAGDEPAHLIHFFGIYRKDGLDLETEGDAVGIPAVGFIIGHYRGADVDILCCYSVTGEELGDFADNRRRIGVDLLEVVAGLGSGDGPGNLVGRDFNFRKALDGNPAVLIGEVIQSGF